MKRHKTNYLFILFFVMLFSCENEPYNLDVEKINAQTELFNDLKTIAKSEEAQKDTVCLTFIYPFNIYLYNSENEIISSKIIGNNLEFIAALDATDENGSIGLSYPINSTLINGDTLSIQNNEELKEALETCIESQIIMSCDNQLQEKNCVWKIVSSAANKEYDNSLLDFYNDGTGIFYDKGNAYQTSWISLFIEEKLHINIHLEGNSQAAQDWNFDWNAVIINDDTVEINNGDNRFKLKKECNVENLCDYVEFRECGLKDSFETSEFILENYIDCIGSLQSAIEDPSLFSFAFFENLQDAEQAINPLDSSTYQNKTNPQLIYVKSKNINESYITRIVLFVENCE